MHFNIRSLQRNFDQKHEILSKLSVQPDIIALTETKLSGNSVYSNIELNGYDFLHADSETLAGGVGLYIQNKLDYSVNSEINCELNYVENIWIKTQTRNGTLMIGVVYRHPVTYVEDIENFSNAMSDILHEFNHKKYSYMVVGDFNLDLMKVCSNNNNRKYANNLISCSCKCLIGAPTRVTESSKTLLDHIYESTNDAPYHTLGGIVLSDITDHLPVFAIKSSKMKKSKLNNDYHFRDMTNFDPEIFADEMHFKIKNLMLPDHCDINAKFDEFNQILGKVINKFAPLKKASRKQKRWKKTVAFLFLS